MEDQENQKEEQSLGGQIVDTGKQAVKNAAENAAKDALKKGVKEAGKAVGEGIKQLAVKFILPALPYIIPVILILVLVLSIYAFKDKIMQTLKNIGTSIVTFIGIGDNGPVAPSVNEINKLIDDALKEEGIDVEQLDMGSESQRKAYLYKYMAASLSTQLPYIKESTAETFTEIAKKGLILYAWDESREVNGIVHIKRNTGTETKDLTYKKYEEFSKMISDNDNDAVNYYSIDENWMLCVARRNHTMETGGGLEDIKITSELIEEKIPYQTMISNYSVPFEFFMALQQITLNPEYVSAVADLVQDKGEIELTIFDSKEETELVTEYKYKEMERKSKSVPKWNYEKGKLEKEIVWYDTEKEDLKEKTKTSMITNTTSSITARVTKANVWIFNVSNEYKRKTTTEYPLTEQGVTTKLDDEQPPQAETAGKWEIERSETITAINEKREWILQNNKEEVDYDKFLGLWRNGHGYYFKGDSYIPKPLGLLVYYKKPDGLFIYESPVENILSSEDWLYDILEKSENTQKHAQLMRYLIALYRANGDKSKVDVNLDIDIFNPNEFNTVSTIEGNSIQDKVWNALISAGFSEYSAAGLMGNIQYESGFNPSYIENGYDENTGGIGICQWTNTARGSTGRNTNLKNYATSKGNSWQDEDIQLQFLLTEILGNGDADGYASYQFITTTNDRYEGQIWKKDEWANATDLGTATKAFCYTFERPDASKTNISKRIQYASDFYNKYHGKSSNVAQYYQNDYSSYPYGHGGTIATSGCGPTAFAMVATTLTGNTITPVDAVSWCGDAYHVKNAGTSWSYFAAAAKHFELPYSVKQTGNINEVVEALRNGKLVISSQGKGLFTSEGHFILLTNIVGDKIHVNDPNKKNAVDNGYNDRGFTIDEISKSGRQYWIFI